MSKLKVLIILCVSLCLVFISFSLVFISSRIQVPGHNIYKNNEMLLVFLPMKHTSKIVDATFDNNKLIVNIDNGEEIVTTVTSLKRRFSFQLIRPNETLEVAGTDRINHYGVVHLSVSTPRPTHGRITMTIVQDGFVIRKFVEKPGPFSNSGAYRIGERITAYCHLPARITPSLKLSAFGIEFKTENTTTFVDENSDPNGNRVLKIAADEFGIPNKNLSFLLKDLKPHETVEVDEKKKMGDDLYLVDLKVVPKNKQVIKSIQMNRPPMNRPNLEDR